MLQFDEDEERVRYTLFRSFQSRSKTSTKNFRLKEWSLNENGNG